MPIEQAIGAVLIAVLGLGYAVYRAYHPWDPWGHVKVIHRDGQPSEPVSVSQAPCLAAVEPKAPQAAPQD